MKTHFILMSLLLSPILATSQALQRSTNAGIQASQLAMKVSRDVSMNNTYYNNTGNTLWNYKITSRYLENKAEKKAIELDKIKKEIENINIDLNKKKEKLDSLKNNSGDNTSELYKKIEKDIEKDEKKLYRTEEKKDFIAKKNNLYILQSQNYKQQYQDLDIRLKQKEEAKRIKEEKKLEKKE